MKSLLFVISLLFGIVFMSIDAKAQEPNSKNTEASSSDKSGSGSKDYCGSKDFNVPELNHNNSCKEHDKCYETIGAEKDKCDRDFHQNMYHDCDRDYDRNGSTTDKAKNTACKLGADIYHSAVKDHGHVPYMRAQTESMKSQLEKNNRSNSNSDSRFNIISGSKDRSGSGSKSKPSKSININQRGWEHR